MVETPGRGWRSRSRFQDLHGAAGQAQSHDAGEDPLLSPTVDREMVQASASDLNGAFHANPLLYSQLPKCHNQVNV